jgi:uncharacterized membrane protein
MSRYFDYLYIFATIVFTVYGQIILKWRIAKFGPLPIDFGGKIKFLIGLLFDPVIFSGFFAAFLASLAWMAAMTKFDLSHGYPFMSLNFVIVLFLSGYVLNEPVTMQKILGVGMIALGTILASKV